ncbi:MAG: CBS domain-containing protein [Sedimentisphaerales bacterium]|nr:CBS domain-containing protein [Sedimentisphaerales bacterium]
MADKKRFIDIAKNKVKGFSTTNYVTSPNIWMEINQVMSRDVATISSNETVASAAMLMSEKNISCIVVVENGNVTGILTETDILVKTVVKGKDTRRIKVAEVMSSPVKTAPSDMLVLEAGEFMEVEHIKRLPIMDGDILAGIVTQTDLTRVLTSYGMWRDISEIMSKDVCVIQKDTSVAEAAKVMASRNISSIVVMNDGQVAGILTERDLFKRVVALNKNPQTTKTGDVMSFPVFSVPPNYSVFSASRTMENNNIRRLAVLEDRKLRGIVTQTDIFKAVKDKIQSEEETVLGFMDESKIGFYMTDLNHVVTYVNPAFVRLFEASESNDFLNREFLQERFWIDPEERANFLGGLDKEFIRSKELSLRTCKGKKIYVTVFSSPTTGIGGELNGYQGIVYDITEKKELSAFRRAEEALRESEKKWRLLAENVPDVILSVRKDGRIQFINRAITGFDVNDVIGKTIYEYIPPEHHQKVGEAIERVFLTKKSESYEIGAPGEHGANTVWETRVVPVMVEGRVEVVNLISTDITERMEFQERQAKLLNRVQKINRELNDFARIVSHDLKEPLRTIKIAAKWISDDCKDVLDEKGKEHLELLSNQVTRMYDLIDNVLKYSRAGHLKNQKEWIDLKVLMPQIISMVSVPEHIEITIDDELPVIEFERTQIAQVFQNLLSNAIKYIDKPSGHIRIGCLAEEDNWKFSVADNGCGIDKENFEKIFQIYQTLGSGDGFRSTGIGLTLVKKIIETYGGAIWVESQPGRGCTFFFTLPKQDNQLENARLETSAAC